MNNNTNTKKDREKPIWQRHVFMSILSLVIVVTIVVASYRFPEEIYGTDFPGYQVMFPFSTCLAGILLFIMSISRQKREAWSLKKYWGDHCYRIAQAFAYLFIVLWAWKKADATLKGTDVSPNILGFLVGYFILRVERAMESLGEKFEEVLTSILPRSVTYLTVQERRRQQLKDTYKLEDAITQYEAIRPMIENKAVVNDIENTIYEATGAAGKEDPEETKKRINKVVHQIEDVRQGLNESMVPLDDLIDLNKKGRSEPNE